MLGLKMKRSSENLGIQVFRRPCFYLRSSTSSSGERGWFYGQTNLILPKPTKPPLYPNLPPPDGGRDRLLLARVAWALPTQMNTRTQITNSDI